MKSFRTSSWNVKKLYFCSKARSLLKSIEQTSALRVIIHILGNNTFWKYHF